MHVVAIYNNKGGVGKSTLTVGLAEFLAGNRKKRVLVVDLDAQASSSAAILGHEGLRSARRKGMISSELILAARTTKRSRKPMTNLDEFLSTRPESGARGTALRALSVLCSDERKTEEVEELLGKPWDVFLMRDRVKPALAEMFDFVLVDLPSHLKKRDKVPMNGLLMSDFVVVPIEPAQISLSAMPATFDLITQAQQICDDGRPALLGMIRNKTDRRTEQYKAKFPHIEREIEAGHLPPLFKNFLPEHPRLATATDEMKSFRTLKERFEQDYDPVRKVAVELEQRCDAYEFTPRAETQRYGHWFSRLLDSLSGAGAAKKNRTAKKGSK